MGVIKSQSIYSTIASYVGVVIGFVTSALIMPKLLSTDQLGLIKLIVAITGIFSGVFSFGVVQLLFRTYHKYTEQDQLSRLFSLVLKIAALGSLIVTPLIFYYASDIFNMDSPVKDFYKGNLFVFVVIIAIVARIFYNAINGYIKMQSKVVIDAIIQNIVLKGGILIFLVLFALNIFSFSNFLYTHTLLCLIFPIILLWYMRRNKISTTLKSSYKFSRVEIKHFYKLSFFGTLTTVGGSLYLYLDTLMVSQYLGESEVGIYSTMYLFGVIVSVPARGLKSAAVSILAKSFEEENFKEIQVIYQKSSITLLIVGGFIFLGVYTNLYAVFGYLPEAFAVGKNVVLLIGLAQLFDMLAGVNYEIIATSRHYKVNTWLVFISIVIAILTNIIFIPIYGISGAAIATALSIVILNVLRFITVKYLFDIQPFTKATLIYLVVFLALLFALESIPNLENPFMNLFYKGGILTITYIPIIYFLKLSSDINTLIDSLLLKLKLIKTK